MAKKSRTQVDSRKQDEPETPWLQMQLETEKKLKPELEYHKFLVERERNAAPEARNRSFFRNRREVIVVPGFMASQLSDETRRGYGLVWIDPINPKAMAKLKLAEFSPDQPETEADAAVKIYAHDPPPGLYSNLFYNLRWYDCGVEFHPVDWRKNLEVAAAGLVQRIAQNRQSSNKPLFLVAHSQGALVARRALQLLGPTAARQMVQQLLLLGPANAGTFSAVLAAAGSHSFLELAKTLRRDPGPEFLEALKSFSGLYQLFPYNREFTAADPDRYKLDFLKNNDVRTLEFWNKLGVAVDVKRLAAFEKWSYDIDTNFFADRITILLGDDVTCGGVTKSADGKLEADASKNTHGDGTVPDAMARLPDAVAYRVTGATHMWLGMNPTVVEAATSAILGRTMHIEGTRGVTAKPKDGVETLVPWTPPTASPASIGVGAVKGAVDAVQMVPRNRHYSAPGDMLPPEPSMRRLRVFSFDPVQGRTLEGAGTAVISVAIPWSDGDGAGLQPGPVGEYLEVVDVDPASQCVYPPVNLNDPNLLAQDGMPPSEGHPWFHQQMVYAVAMKTIEQFEGALGRRSLWSDRIFKNANGGVDSEYVARLRIYPHALAEANAYYDPSRKALLFGYFNGSVVDSMGNTVGGETTFTALSYDVIAHETTHALLDGLHRYFNMDTNPDVFAFHEAFADIVALFQHFSHPEVLRDQMAKARGDLKNENQLGGLAVQFGQAMGERGGALRQYIGREVMGSWELIKPDHTKLAKTMKPHDRGAILVAAVFRAFLNIYEHRIADLKRIATGGTGIFDDGDLHPDLVGRLADEAAKSARHVLRMCIRALDYLPPTDVTFGEYLRAVVTADYDIVKNDDRGYRIAVVAAFRDWGILPPNVRSFSVDSLVWDPPQPKSLRNLSDVLAGLNFERWDRRVDRRVIHEELVRNRAEFHNRMNDLLTDEHFESLGIARDTKLSTLRIKDGKTVFAVHSIRPSRRIGPDDEYRYDLVIELVQKRKGYLSERDQIAADGGDQELLLRPDFWMYGGSTLIVDPKTGDIRYCLRKRTPNKPDRVETIREYQKGLAEQGGALTDERDHQPFRMLHKHG